MKQVKEAAETIGTASQPAAPAPGTRKEPVADVLDRYGKLNLRLIAEMRDCWGRLAVCLSDCVEGGGGAVPDSPQTGSLGLNRYIAARDAIGRLLLEGLLRRLKREQLPSRFLAALRANSDGVLNLWLSLSPGSRPSVESAGKAGSTADNPLVPPALGFLQKRPVPARTLIGWEVHRSRKRRLRFAEAILAEAFGAISDGFTCSGLSLTLFDLRVNAGTQGPVDNPIAGQAVDFLSKREDRAARLFNAWEAWERKRHRKLGESLETRRSPRPSPAVAAEPRFFVHWAEQSRLLEFSGQFALKLFSTEQSVLRHAESAFREVAGDNAGLAEQYTEVCDSLKSYAAGENDEFAGQVRHLPASRRFLGARTQIDKELAALPERVGVFCGAVPAGKRPRRRFVFPRKVALMSARRLLEPEVTQVGEEIAQNQLRVIQEIERAREVVAFGRELGDSEAGGSELAGEATANAVALLEDFGKRISQILERPALEERVISAVALTFAESRVVGSQQHFRVIRHVARHELRRATSLALGTFTPIIRENWLRLTDAVAAGANRLAVALGLRAAAPDEKVQVRVRPFLPADFTVDLSSRQIPPLYRHLFRLEPVQDPRFLVGRDREIQAIVDARTMWESGRPVAVVIVGQRGSGKTSLMNCALLEALSGLDVARGEFGRRLLQESQLEEFIARVLGCSPSQITESVRRVVILEETERCYLKQVGGYSAVRALQRIISATGTSMFWLVSINEMAYRFISGTTGLAQVFSHRINAGTATRAELKEAVLLRHRLSGLRLHFMPAADRSGKERKGDEAEQLFFEGLFKQSAGVFRTAFDIWLGHIDRVEDGVMTMRPIILADLAPVVEDLPFEQVFTLLAILQHGALTVEEHAAVFQLAIPASRARLEELLAREIIEKDPGREGLRVRPEAMPLVREALYRRNLAS